MFTLVSPLKVAISKNKDWILNLNNYRNTHYQTLNKSKIVYKDVMSSQVDSLPTFTKPLIIYRLYPKTKRLCDTSNICSIHDKYFSDVLTEMGKIEDDNYLVIPRVCYEFGAVDSDNPRVEIDIKETKNEN